jgi:hypothetical protein
MPSFPLGASAAVPADRPVFLITVDVEGDNLWARPRVITTRNAACLARFQALCEASGLRPTYLVNYEMATSPVFQEIGRDVLRRGSAEIGVHLHAWNTPPLVALTPDDLAHQPYLIEYPETVVRQKVRFMTDLLGETFGLAVVSHRAGRWAFNEIYARALVASGYRVDCSVTPGVSWRAHKGDPRGAGGSDYTRFPREPYFVNLEDVGRPGDSPLLEIPMTIVPTGAPALPGVRRYAERVPVARRLVSRLAPQVRWLRPDRRNGSRLVRLVTDAVRERCTCLEFMLHSSELMPGGSPLFPRQADVERLYEDLAGLFAAARRTCAAATLQEHHARLAAGRATSSSDRRHAGAG